MVVRTAMAKAPKKPEEVERLPDAWERFERAVDVVIKAKPKHRESSSKGKHAKKDQSGKSSRVHDRSD